MLEPIKKKFPLVSYADLFQLASATAIELVTSFLYFESQNLALMVMCLDQAGGPKIPMR